MAWYFFDNLRTARRVFPGEVRALEAGRIHPDLLIIDFESALDVHGRARVTRALKEIVRKYPAAQMALSALVQIYEQAGQNRLAISWARRGVEGKPASSLPFADLGRVLMRAGRADEAIGYLHKALEINPVSEAGATLVLAYAVLSDPNRALDAAISYLSTMTSREAERLHKRVEGASLAKVLTTCAQVALGAGDPAAGVALLEMVERVAPPHMQAAEKMASARAARDQAGRMMPTDSFQQLLQEARLACVKIENLPA